MLHTGVDAKGPGFSQNAASAVAQLPENSSLRKGVLEHAASTIGERMLARSEFYLLDHNRMHF